MIYFLISLIYLFNFSSIFSEDDRTPEAYTDALPGAYRTSSPAQSLPAATEDELAVSSLLGILRTPVSSPAPIAPISSFTEPLTHAASSWAEETEENTAVTSLLDLLHSPAPSPVPIYTTTCNSVVNSEEVPYLEETVEIVRSDRDNSLPQPDSPLMGYVLSLPETDSPAPSPSDFYRSPVGSISEPSSPNTEPSNLSAEEGTPVIEPISPLLAPVSPVSEPAPLPALSLADLDDNLQAMTTSNINR